MSGRFVAVVLDGITSVHASGSLAGGGYATLCGLDGNDLASGQSPTKLPERPRIDCPQCAALWLAWQNFSSRDFASSNASSTRCGVYCTTPGLSRLRRCQRRVGHVPPCSSDSDSATK